MIRSYVMAAAVAATAAVLTGCGTMVRVNHETQATVASTKAQVAKSMAQFDAMPPPTRLVTVSDVPYVNTKEIAYTQDYPARFSEPAVLSFNSGSVRTLMTTLNSLTGYNVVAGSVVSGDALPPHSGGSQGVAPTTGGRVAAIRYSGTMKGMLDEVAQTLNATWSFDSESGTIRFFQYETKVFHIATTPGQSTSTHTLGGGSGHEVSGGQGQAVTVGAPKGSVSFATKLDLWNVIKSNVAPMLSATGTLSVSEPTASIVVHDRWDHVAQVAAYVKELNRSLTMEVQVSVTVYRVARNRSDSRGFNWSALYNALSQRAHTFGVDISTPRPSDAGMSSLVLTSPSQSGNSTNSAPFAGSQAFLDALDEIGDTAVVTRGGAVTTNNVSAPIRQFNSQGYLAQTTSLLTGGTGGIIGGSPIGAGATLMPGTVETGFQMTVLPSVQPDGHRILLEASITLSELESLLSVSSGGQSIQVPDVSGQQLMPRTWLRSGSTLVIAEFGNNKSQRNTATPFGEHTWALGGNRKNSIANEAIVVTITPVATSYEGVE